MNLRFIWTDPDGSDARRTFARRGLTRYQTAAFRQTTVWQPCRFFLHSQCFGCGQNVRRPFAIKKHFAPEIEWWNDRKEINIDGFDKAKKYSKDFIVERNYNLDLCGYPHEEEEILPPKDLIQQYLEKRASLNAEIDRTLSQIIDILGIDLDVNMGSDEQ